MDMRQSQSIRNAQSELASLGRWRVVHRDGWMGAHYEPVSWVTLGKTRARPIAKASAVLAFNVHRTLRINKTNAPARKDAIAKPANMLVKTPTISLS